MIHPETQWPEGAVADDNLYSLEVSHSMRPLMAENDTSPDKIASDELGQVTWIHVNKDVPLIPDFDTLTGTYAEVSAEAGRRNDALGRIQHPPAFIFYPSIISKLAA